MKAVFERSSDLRCPYCRTVGTSKQMGPHIRDCAKDHGNRLPKEPPVPDPIYTMGAIGVDGAGRGVYRSRSEEAEYRATLDPKSKRAYYIGLFEEDGRFSWTDTLRKTADILFPDD